MMETRRIVWDEVNRAANLAKHGMDFGDLTIAFIDDAVIVPGNVAPRLVAVGYLNGVTVAATFRPLGTEAISVISMRRASEKERRLL